MGIYTSRKLTHLTEFLLVEDVRIGGDSVLLGAVFSLKLTARPLKMVAKGNNPFFLGPGLYSRALLVLRRLFFVINFDQLSSGIMFFCHQFVPRYS